MEGLMKKTAEELLKIADEIDAQAADVTNFVCDKCNHTTTLSKINATRKTAAGAVGNNVTVSDISVNDKVACPAPECGGTMSYKASDASAPYYYDEDAKVEAAKEPAPKEIAEEKKETPEEQAKEEKGEKLHEEPHEASIDYDALDRYTKG